MDARSTTYNIIIIGETGSGISFLNSLTTVLTNSDHDEDIYRAYPITNREESATKKVGYKKTLCFKLQLLKQSYNL